MKIKKQKTISFCFVITVTCLLISLGAIVTYQNYTFFKEYIQQEISKQFGEKEREIREEIDYKKLILNLLSFNPYVVDILSEDLSNNLKKTIRNYLTDIGKKNGLLAIFLLNEKGDCILSTDVRFEGKNYSFRPYFKQAVSSGQGLYVAMGVTSHKLGLYLSKRIRNYFGRFGILVVKIDPFSLLRGLSLYKDERFSVWGATASGVLFNPYKNGFYLLEKISPSQLERIFETKQFQQVKFKRLGFPKGTWNKLKQNSKILVNKDGLQYKIRKISVLNDSFFIITIVSSDFIPPSLEMVKKAFLTTNSAFIIALLPLIVSLVFIRRQYRNLLYERAEKNKNLSRYMAVLTGNKDGFIVMNGPELEIDDVNDKFYEIIELDKKKHSLIGSSFFSVLKESEKDNFIRKIQKNKNFVFRTEIYNSKGESIPVIIDFTQYHIWNNQTGENEVFYCAFIQDLRKGLKEAQKIHLLETAVEQSGSCIAITDKDRKIIYVNPAFKKITGYSAEELLGKDIKLLRSAQNDNKFYSKLWHDLKRGRMWQGRICNKRKDGKLYWVDATITPILNERGQITHFIFIKNDVTKLVELEERLHQKIQELEGIMEHADVIIALIKDRKFLSVNAKFTKLFGKSKEELIGTSTKILYHSQEEYEYYGKKFYDALKRGKPLKHELEYILPSGEKKWFQITATAINPGSIEDMKTVWIANDITDLKQLQLKLEIAKEKAERASKAKSIFLANMSHEIRTPLNGVIGMLSLLSGTELDSIQKEYVQTAHSSAEALLFLINDILDIAKIEEGKMELDVVDFDFFHFIHDFSKSFALAARQKGLDFELELDENIPKYLKGDPGRLRQILTNLTNNALKFTEKGKIELKVTLAEETRENAIIKFFIKDTGIGIPKDKCDRLFKKFSQVDPSISRKYGGTGLGLSLSKQLVKLMNGDIGVDSEVNKGSTFWFKVILQKGDPTAIEAIRDEQDVFSKEHALEGRILVVEDNSVNQRVILGILRKLGLQAEAVTNGQEAIDTLKVISYDLVLMDVQMPVMDGLTATRMIRSGEVEILNNNIPIIALTAHSFKDEILKCIDAGMNDYLTKPIDIKKLLHVLYKWLPEKKAEKRKGVDMLRAEPGIEEQSMDVPIFDLNEFSERTMGDKELGKQVLDMFLENSEKLISGLQVAISESNKEEIMRMSHSLKGSAANVCAKRIVELAYKLEKIAKENNIKKEKIDKKLIRLKEELELFYNHDKVRKMLAK